MLFRMLGFDGFVYICAPVEMQPVPIQWNAAHEGGPMNPEPCAMKATCLLCVGSIITQAWDLQTSLRRCCVWTGYLKCTGLDLMGDNAILAYLGLSLLANDVRLRNPRWNVEHSPIGWEFY